MSPQCQRLQAADPDGTERPGRGPGLRSSGRSLGREQTAAPAGRAELVLEETRPYFACREDKADNGALNRSEAGSWAEAVLWLLPPGSGPGKKKPCSRQGLACHLCRGKARRQGRASGRVRRSRTRNIGVWSGPSRARAIAEGALPP